MNTWQALKKIVRDQFTRPVQQPWNGEHELKYCVFVEVADYMTYYTGWEWRCTCGVGTPPMPTYLLASEEEALLRFRQHRDSREGL